MRSMMLLASLSAFALALSCTAMAQEKAEAEEQEVTVKFDTLPQVVKTTFKEESGGATITEVEKETENGETVYEAEVTIKGKKYEIEVSEDGTLLEKSLVRGDDHEDDDKDDDDDDKDDAKEKAKP